MPRIMISLTVVLVISMSAAVMAQEPTGAAVEQDRVTVPRPRMDVVFVLDTTGSMSGLIATAKEKIWAVANEILRGKPTPVLRIGLVAYRDRKDAYVTKRFALTGDLDAVHRNLMGLVATGGGDTPEHVSRALHEAVQEMAWSEAEGAIKIIFLVGDAPPHTDYDDGFDYRQAARASIGRGIMINTLRIGEIKGTEEVWREIARMADGSYRKIKVIRARPKPAVRTEYDRRIVALRAKLGRAALGPPAVCTPSSPAGSAARGRVSHLAFASASRRADVIDDIIAGRVKINAVPEARLTPELKKLGGTARIARLEKLVTERKALTAELAALEGKRTAVVAEKTEALARKAKLADRKDSFDRAVVDAVKKAASKKGIKYGEPEKKADG